MGDDSTTTPSEHESPEASTKSLREAWQLPALAGAMAVLLGAGVYAFMTRPKPDVTKDFEAAERLMEERSYGEALEHLGQRVLPVLNKGGLNKEQERGLYLMRARALYLGQKEAGVSRVENHENIVKEYERALKLEATLQAQDQAYRARTYLELGRLDEAGILAVDLPEAMRDERIELLQGVIDASVATPVGLRALTGHAAGHGDAGHSKTGHVDAGHGDAGHGDAGHAESGQGSGSHGSGAHGGVLSRPGNDAQRAFDLLDVLAKDPQLTDDQRLWVLTRQSRWLLAKGDSEQVITKILRTLPRLDLSASRAVRAEVLITLARAYIAQHDLEGAIMPLETALSTAGAFDPLAAEIDALRGKVAQELEDFEGAREHYSKVLAVFEHSPWRASARLGLAEAEAALALEDTGAIETAFEHYDALVDALERRVEQRGRFDPMSEEAVEQTELVESLLDRSVEQFDRDQLRLSLRFASLAERAAALKVPAAGEHGDGHGDEAHAAQSEGMRVPDLTLVLAEVRRLIADELLGDEGAKTTLASLDATTQREAREHLMIAARRYLEHAEQVVQSDQAAYADALWNAADSYDRAGDSQESVRVFERFVKDLPRDPRQPEAVFRVGIAHRALGDLKASAKAFRSLIVDADGSGRNGPFSDASYVPLAQVLLGDDDASNDAEASTLLEQVLSGRLGGTGTRRYREALLEAGEVAYRGKQFERAIERWGEYVDRARAAGGQDAQQTSSTSGFEASPLPGLALVTYKLADAYRLSAREMDRVLGGALPDSDARELRSLRGKRLTRAQGLFEEAIALLEGQGHRSGLDEVALRNAYFYRADCAFDQKEFEQAIRHYESARERYAKDPASLVALTQIVGAYMAMEQWDRARVANARARKFYAGLPEGVWDDPSLPMSRREWERWLEAQSDLARQGGAEAVASENEME